MTDLFSDVAVLIRACCNDFRDPGPWPAPDGYPDSLALCIIDAAYTVGARPTPVASVISRYREMRTQAGGDADFDSADDLATTVRQAGGPDRWAAWLGCPEAQADIFIAPRKAATVATAAHVLPHHGVVTTADLRSAVADPGTLDPVRQAWRGAVGPGCGNTWQHLLRLAHTTARHPDRSVIRYVANAVGIRPSLLTSQHAAQLIDAVALEMNWNTTALGHAMWRYQSGRNAHVVNLPPL